MLARVHIAGAAAATHPNRAGRLIADAEEAAQSITNKYLKALALTSIAEAVAAADVPGVGQADSTKQWTKNRSAEPSRH